MKPALGPIPWLPPRAWCAQHLGDHYSGGPCANCQPVGGAHVFALYDAELEALRAVHLLRARGLT